MNRTSLFRGLPLAALALALAAAPAFARPGGGDGGPRGSGPGMDGPPPPLSEIVAEHADEIGLDDATLDQLMALIEGAEPELQALHEQVDAGEGPPDRELRETIHQARRDLMEQVEAMLSDQQLDSLRELLPPPPGEGGEDGPPPCREDGEEG